MSDSTSYSTSINPGAPPLRWDNVYEAFRQVNANFEILEAALGASGITPINFSDLDSSVIPSSNAIYVLGDITKQWKSVFTAAYSEVPGNELNGLWAGSAQIKGVGFTVNLPAGSTIGGNPETGVGAELIIDPDKNWFKTIQIDGGDSIVATEVNDTFNIVSGNGISLDVDSAAESIEITNTGILDVTAGLGISRTIVSGTANIVNTGVLSLANTGSIGTRTSGLGIHVSSAAGNPVITNTGVLGITAGTGALIVSTDAVTGVVTITNNSPAQPAFQQVEVDGDSANRLVADSTAGVLRVVSGYGIALAKTVGTDTLTITVDPAFDLKGSVFADDSTVLVDAVAGVLRGTLIGNLIGDAAGNHSGTLTGNVTGDITGNVTGNVIGDIKGSVFGDDSTKIIDAVENKVYAEFFGNLTGNVTGNLIGDVTGTVTGNVFTNSIDSADSSAIVITPLARFESDVIVENDLTVAEVLIVKGSRVINLAELQSVVAASADFADFQTRIAALV